jgi:hypothetical protein
LFDSNNQNYSIYLCQSEGYISLCKFKSECSCSVFLIHESNVTLETCALQNGCKHPAIFVGENSKAKILNCLIENKASSGIEVKIQSQCQIQSAIIQNCGYGISVSDQSSVCAENCIFSKISKYSVQCFDGSFISATTFFLNPGISHSFTFFGGSAEFHLSKFIHSSDSHPVFMIKMNGNLVLQNVIAYSNQKVL